VLLKCGKNYGIDVYVPKETILKEMAAKIELCQHFFYLVREYAVCVNLSEYANPIFQILYL
jgi:hypothetical protein